MELPEENKSDSSKVDTETSNHLAREEAMHGVCVDEDRVDDPSNKDDEDGASNPSALHKYCLENSWTDGEKAMVDDGYLVVKDAAEKRIGRKRLVSKFVLDNVAESKELSSNTVGKEMESVVEAPWSNYVHSLDIVITTID